MLDISGILNTVMEDNQCSSICAFLFLAEDKDEQLHESLQQLHDTTQSDNLGTRN